MISHFGVVDKGAARRDKAIEIVPDRACCGLLRHGFDSPESRKKYLTSIGEWSILSTSVHGAIATPL
jgi:hypothetical protein